MEGLTGELRNAEEELRTLRRELIQASKMAELGTIAATMVHELKQPLFGIKSFAQMMLEKLPEDSPFKKKVAQIIEQSVRMEEIIRRIREFSRKSGEATFFDINEPIGAALELLAHGLRKSNIRVLRGLSPELPKIKGDFNQIEQVFINLIDNARDAIEGINGGMIGVETRQGTENQGVEAVVYDNGYGIPEEFRNNVFKSFFTTKEKEKGTGLGLFICQEIIRDHGGEIRLLGSEEITREINEGAVTAFKIKLPKADLQGDGNGR
ncbi:MAG: GHKL domain-containing protein [Deltaproteobacteria bacterium]|nr:MAG: GHKL domain-containing protein [Deltaproteobacteria bacterium]